MILIYSSLKQFITHLGIEEVVEYFHLYLKELLPFIFRTAKPSAKEFVSSVVKDTIKGKRPIKQYIKKTWDKSSKGYRTEALIRIW